jgi:hypothetical protein
VAHRTSLAFWTVWTLSFKTSLSWFWWMQLIQQADFSKSIFFSYQRITALGTICSLVFFMVVVGVSIADLTNHQACFKQALLVTVHYDLAACSAKVKSFSFF